MGRIAGLTPEETKRRVLEAAARVFADRGFEGARVAHIASEAGLSVGAIYNHYGSKADLLAAVADAHFTDELSGLLTGSGASAGVLDLIATLGARLERELPSASLLAEVLIATRRDPDAAARLRTDVVERESLLADVVRFGQSAGEVVDDVDPAVIARYCLMLGLGSLLVRSLELPPTDGDEWSSFIERLVDGFRTAS